MGTFCCYEVTIGFGGNERCDYVTYSTKGIWRFYEIKVSKSDFHSKANKTFLGHYNYYVMPKELYEEVKNEIPKDIGVYVGQMCVKKPKKRKLGVSEKTLRDSMIRSLYREVEKLIRSGNETTVQGLERRLYSERKAKEDYQNRYYELKNKVIDKYGYRWDKE